jgi:hypothetical protein
MMQQSAMRVHGGVWKWSDAFFCHAECSEIWGVSSNLMVILNEVKSGRMGPVRYAVGVRWNFGVIRRKLS